MIRRPMCLMCLLLVGMLFLADRMGFPLIQGNPVPEPVREYIREHPQVTVIGEVQRCADTEFSKSVYLKKSFLIYQPDSVKESHKKQSVKIPLENIKAFLKEDTEVPAGAVLMLSGKLEEVPAPGNPGEFDSRQYYACQHIYYNLKNAVVKKQSETYSLYRQWLVSLREKAVQVLNRAAGADGALFSSVVLGDKRELQTEIKMRYQMAGIIHFLAISGLHISILGMGVYHILMKLGAGIRISGFLGMAIMVQYGVLIGSSVSAIRALVMFLLMVIGRIIGRIYDMPTALSIAAVLILLESPAYLYSSSFLLSFGAVIGIGIVVPVAQEYFAPKTRIGKSFLGSVFVQVTTLPVLLWSYGEVSVLGCVLNLIVLPTAGGVLLSGVSALLCGVVWAEAAIAAALPGRVILHIYEWLCILAGQLPFCTWIGGSPQAWQTVVYYVGLGLIVGGMKFRAKKRKEREQASGYKKRQVWTANILVSGAILLLAVMLGVRPVKELSVTCLDVGQGDCIAVETPQGNHFLIDCGSSNKSDVGQYQLLPYLKNQGISFVDGIFVSHTDQDHISGIMELLEYTGRHLTTIRVGTLWLPDWEKPPKEWEQLKALAEKAGVTVERVRQGDRLTAGRTTLSVLAPEKGAGGADVNEEGMVLQLEYGDFQAIFTGDIGAETEERLLEQLVDVEFLKVGHHGSRYSSCESFLEKIRPEVSVISCSSKNTYGHPAQETIERLKAVGSRVEFTMKSGAVRVKTDGTTYSVCRYAEKKMDRKSQMW